MKRLFLAVSALVGLLFASVSLAQDSFGVCESSDSQCQALAVEVRKMQLSDELQMSAPRLDTSFLCPEGNPDCCPPELQPVCAAHASLIVKQTHLALTSQRLADNCPWTSAICNSLGTLYCGPDSGWNPWDGCSQIAELPPIPEPPPSCPVGQRWNGKVCISVPCFHPRFGVEIPCGPISGDFVAVLPDTQERALREMVESAETTRAARSAVRRQAQDALDLVSQ